MLTQRKGTRLASKSLRNIALAAGVAAAACIARPTGSQERWFGMAFAGAPYEHALDFVDLLGSGHFEEAHDLLSPSARRVWSAARLGSAWKEQEDRKGDFFKREVSAVELDGDRWRVHVLCLFVRGRADVVLEFTTLSDDPTVLSLQFREAVPGRIPG